MAIERADGWTVGKGDDRYSIYEHGQFVCAAHTPEEAQRVAGLLQSVEQWAKAYELQGREHDALLRRVDALAQFASDIIAATGGSLDGCDIEDIAVKCGLLVKEEMAAPCDEENCECASCGAEFPTICNRKTALLLGSAPSTPAPQVEPEVLGSAYTITICSRCDKPRKSPWIRESVETCSCTPAPQAEEEK